MTHEEMRWAIGRILRDHFEMVGFVPDGRRLVEAALLLRPDVIVSDIAMPVLTGPEAMRELESQCHGAPFVLMSGNLSDLEQWIEQGAAAFVDKVDIGYAASWPPSALPLRGRSISRAARALASFTMRRQTNPLCGNRDILISWEVSQLERQVIVATGQNERRSGLPSVLHCP